MDDFCPQKGVEIMHGKTTHGTGILFFVIFLFVSLSGCLMTTGMSTSSGPPPWARGQGNRTQHHYRYYTYHRVYFDEQRGVYFFLSNGSWQMSVSLPSYIQITVNDFVTLDMDTDKPYEYHNDVIKRYPPGQEKKKDQDIDKNKSQEKGQNKVQDTEKNKSQEKGQKKSQDQDKDKSEDQNKSKDKNKDKDTDKGQDNYQEPEEDNS
jgi:hypothetical protein